MHELTTIAAAIGREVAHPAGTAAGSVG